MSAELNTAVHNISQGKGVLGVLMEDPKATNDLKDAIKQINDVSHSANTIAAKLNNLVSATDTNINNGKGVITALMKDTTIVQQLQNSLDNIEKGTAAFNEDMEALKHNFLLRGYFRKQAKKNKK
jgi:phospholipid/cholesterol/gamma-HCH transport system substrate-binding protein